MSRIALISGPLGALALGGLLFLGPSAGQAQDPRESYTVAVAVAPGEGAQGASDAFDDGKPYPWPDFLDVQPLPGRYRMKVMLVEIDLPDIPEFGDFDMEQVIRSGFPEIEEFCVAPGFRPRRNWLGDMALTSCAEPEITVDGNTFTYAAQCRQDEGGIGDVHISGTVEESRSRIEFDITARDENMGEMHLRMRASTDRIGDCG